MINDKSKAEPHDLASFLEELNLGIQADYDQVRRRVLEDPGTAGDQVEETWAMALRSWLPSHYHVVTKGRVIGQDGEASPQVDVIVLWPSYPPFLIKKKLYLAAGVAAAFECKLTFRKEHLKKLFQNAIRMSGVADREYQERRNLKRVAKQNYAYEEYHRVFEYGLLAHSYAGYSGDKCYQAVSADIESLDAELVHHPNQMVDLICIQDMACWAGERAPYSTLAAKNLEVSPSSQIVRLPHPQSGYSCHHGDLWAGGTSFEASFSPLGSFLARLYKKLSYTDASLIPLASYFTTALATGYGGPLNRVWKNYSTPSELWEIFAEGGFGPHGGGHRFLSF